MNEHNPIWAPIPQPRPKALWSGVGEIIAAYQQAEPVRTSRSQRYSLVVTEALPGPTWGKP